jgi:histidine ammonia-lyase
MKIALSELGAISERRTFRLMDEKLNNGLPAMLVDPDALTGLHSGVMILQYTAAALALENQTLASPDSVRSLPTSANQEDHNANSYNSALHLLGISENLKKILAIELFCAARAIQIRKKIHPDLQLGFGTQKVFDLFQEHFIYNKDDAQWRHDLEKLYALLEEKSKWKRELLSIVN